MLEEEEEKEKKRKKKEKKKKKKKKEKKKENGAAGAMKKKEGGRGGHCAAGAMGCSAMGARGRGWHPNLLLHTHNGRPRAPPCTRPPPLLVDFVCVPAGPPKSGGLGTAPAKITPFFKQVASPKRLFPMLARTTRPAFPCTRPPPLPMEFFSCLPANQKAVILAQRPPKFPHFSSRLQAQNGGFQCN